MEYLQFSFWFIVVHIGAYWLAGVISYPLFYKPFWEGDHPLFEPFLRTRSNAEEWKHVMIWLIPAQLIRALLMSIVLYPILAPLGELSFILRFAFLGGLMFVYADLASAVPFSNTIEGIVYMKARFVRGVFWKMQFEGLIYSLVMGFFVGWFLF